MKLVLGKDFPAAPPAGKCTFDSDALCSLLLFESKDLNILENRIIIEATISFINATKRFDLRDMKVNSSDPSPYHC